MPTLTVKNIPGRPTNIPPHAETCLRALVAKGLNDKISLGGAFGLLHYLDYRPTHDVDAWWDASATTRDKEQAIQVIEAALRPHGQVRIRTWGDVVSIELMQADQTAFSFQVAARATQLQPSVSATWIDVLLDSFPDIVASKMVALVERGAPRDFRDIHALCDADLATPQQCWTLWRQRQRLSASDADSHRARLAVETHLSRITLHRPLDEIADPGQRAKAEQVRTWFREDLLGALVD
jgi:hypothetical protein